MPEGIPYGKTVIVEFDPDSVWYSLAVNIIANCLKSELSADFHAFSNHPDDVRSNLTKLGVDVHRAEESGQLWIIDYYSPGIGVRSKEKWSASSLKLTDMGIDRRKRFEIERRCLHLDDNWSIVFEQNQERDVVQFLRTKIIPATRESQRVQLFGLTRGLHAEHVYGSLEDAAYGIVDIRTQEATGETVTRVRSMKAGSYDKAWYKLKVEPNMEVKLEG